MTLLYASTFQAALGRLTAQEQKQVKVTTVDLMLDPRGNGLQMHRIEKTDGFWSVRVSQDLRIILHQSGDAMLLAYVDHHDAAYRWAERRRLVPHERTGAMQFVEIRELVEEERVSASVPAAPARRPFAALTDDQLLDVGVPRDWVAAVRETAEDGLFTLFEALPAEASEALLDHATGGRIESHVAPKAPPHADPFAHPDAQRRFRAVEGVEELRAALGAPFEQWAVFLHPAQRAPVERGWSGPARISGSAGTGKTIVALHRAVHLARQNANAGVLLTTFSDSLAEALLAKVAILTAAEPALRARIAVRALDRAALEIYQHAFGPPRIASADQIQAAIRAAKDGGLGAGLTPGFLFEEWEEVVDAWALADEESYATVPRLGRKTRLGAKQRAEAWAVFAFLRARLAEQGLLTWPALYGRLTDRLAVGSPFPYTHIVVDEAQDLTVAQARFLAAAGQGGPEALFFAGDLGQRIFHLPFSWARLGLDIRGRSQTLKVCYRTSHQIRTAADRLLPGAISDLDGIEEGRRGTVSVFDGPPPEIALVGDEAEETARVAGFLRGCLASGMGPGEIGVLVRGPGQLDRARAAVEAAGEPGIVIATMHDAKGLEFRAVAVMACDEEVIPDPARLAAVGDSADLEAIHDTERHLLYVAFTRARDRLLVSGLKPGSEFIDDVR